MADRVRVALVCSNCGARNYQTTKARKSGAASDDGRLELKKHCPVCNRHTVHRESK